jgi:hypothetical protein
MRYLALIVALLAVTIGITGVVAPETLFAMMRYAGTPAGLYAAAVGRVAVGVVLIMVAPRSRAPGLLRGLGGLIMLAGMMTPFFGVERTRAVLEWASTQGTALIRAGAALALALGGLLAFAVSPVRRTV